MSANISGNSDPFFVRTQKSLFGRWKSSRMHLVSKPFSTVLEPLTYRFSNQLRDFQYRKYNNNSTLVTHLYEEHCFRWFFTFVSPTETPRLFTVSTQTNSGLGCRPESLSLGQSKHWNANRVNTLHMSVLEGYSYFIGSRASLPSGQGILVITKKGKKNHSKS